MCIETAEAKLERVSGLYYSITFFVLFIYFCFCKWFVLFIVPCTLTHLCFID
ncbi:hypothetical protein C5167_017407 [Papaver somniferum]|uniref:Uncharacterized protein n=1 Tax=Papaver somniferum TaxID=3469 RepID=A0A4Y7IMM4_PAPSO|nr:hypothetical protein C5167_017407 [Papaver somniferum]